MAWIGRLPKRIGLFRFFLLFAGLVMLAGLLGGYAIGRIDCAIYGYQTERETRLAAFAGCLVRVDDGWVPRGELRILQ
ncbi:conserved hypothetical protein [Pseudomonas sp. OF001]|uniref:hypothetical protein n=1 Tax=Pseudomonas sp. OF001 TaxID=2772300 RepID=UPI00191B7A99|nr:hypothetical protein [Pseudomonas sp. OF001]CAD5376747.1 conserved hypothetical protein [Pseudomonas sp. OF001]